MILLTAAVAPKNKVAAGLFAAGITCFSGSIYLLTLDPQRFKALGPVLVREGWQVISAYSVTAVVTTFLPLLTKAIVTYVSQQQEVRDTGRSPAHARRAMHRRSGTGCCRPLRSRWFTPCTTWPVSTTTARASSATSFLTIAASTAWAALCDRPSSGRS